MMDSDNGIEMSYDYLSCPYFGPNNYSHHQQIWTNSKLGHQVVTLSQVCVNGSLLHIELEEWNRRCYPTHLESTALRMCTGIWAFLNFVVGIVGNCLTLTAIPYAKSKHRYELETSFWMTDVWIINLALCDLLFCMFCLPTYFIPYLGYRYTQTYATPAICKFAFTLVKLTYPNDWLILSIIAMTRALKVKYPR